MPRPGPRRISVTIRLSQPGIDRIDERATAAEVTRSEMLRRMVAYADKHMPA